MKRLLPILSLLLVFSCQPSGFTPAPEQLVVEGWIEDGGAPYIYLTTSFAPSPVPRQISSLADQLFTSATVRLSDGEKEVILTGLASKRFYPPFVYTSAYMTGEAGKTYTLTVESSRFHARATATIPPSRPLESLTVVPFGDDPGQRLIEARFRDNPSTKDYYFAFVKIEKTDSTYVPSELSLVDDSLLEGEETTLLLRPGVSLARSEGRQAYRRGERVGVKFRTMDGQMYGIWKAVAEQQAFSALPFFSLDETLPGNVDGALGYFAGYGCSTYEVTIP